MPTALPNLSYDQKTKVNAETMIYAYPQPGQILDQLQFRTGTGGGLHKASNISAAGCCGGDCPCPDSSFEATVTTRRNRAVISTLPINSPVYSAVLGLHNPSGADDAVYHVCLPNFSEMELICFDQGVSPTIGHNQRAIPRKFNQVDHRVRQRPDDSVSFSELFVSSRDGFKKFAGYPITVAVLVTPDGVTSQEITFYSNVVLNPTTVATSAEGNDSITLTFEADFSFQATFSAAKP